MSNPLKQETKILSAPAASEEKSPTVLLSQTDAFIHERMKSLPKTRKEADIRVEEKINADHHRLTLPKELDSFLKEYTFHWVMKKEQSISEALDVKGWLFVNKTHFPELPDYLFKVGGAIERGDLILMYMPTAKAERIRREVAKRSTDNVKARIGAHKGNPDFYVPSDKTEEGEASKVVGL